MIFSLFLHRFNDVGCSIFDFYLLTFTSSGGSTKNARDSQAQTKALQRKFMAKQKIVRGLLVSPSFLIF